MVTWVTSVTWVTPCVFIFEKYAIYRSLIILNYAISMNIELIRTQSSKESIIGYLLVGGSKLCDTAENATTALPSGHYQIVRHFCKQYNRFVPLIFKTQAPADRPGEKGAAHCVSCGKLKYVSNNTNMPQRCPKFCPGNGIHNRTDGAIILGTHIINGCMKSPREPYDNLMERIRKSISRGNEVTLIISKRLRVGTLQIS